jgi:hypothetical protein
MREGDPDKSKRRALILLIHYARNSVSSQIAKECCGAMRVFAHSAANRKFCQPAVYLI